MVMDILCCPKCCGRVAHNSATNGIICLGCGLEMETVEGIPIMVTDRAAIEEQIQSAKTKGKGEWYESPQMAQWSGPYRHHLLKRRRYVEGVLSSYRDRAKRALVGLDLGCGDGGNLIWLKDHFQVLYGTDYNILRLLRASVAERGTRLFLADVTNCPVADNSLDVIFFNHVLEHVPDDEKALSEALRILKPGGLFILGIPNEGAFFWQLAYKLQPKSLSTTDHIHFYTGPMIREKCQRLGWTVTAIHGIGFGVPHWTIDSMVRSYGFMDDAFERIGRRFFPSQATSLYALMTK